jgi:dipeptidyl aminopeptidase/acylaminoacyl peptidase
VPPRILSRAAWVAAVVGFLAAVLAGCGPLPAAPVPATDSASGPGTRRIAIVASERSAGGVRLVAIDEHGDRQFELVQPAAVAARDTNPAVSPDGRWIVFASSRDRPIDQTSLWIAPAGIAAPPRRLTEAAAGANVIDTHPAWLPDGRAIVFASTRAGGGYDLWQLAIHDGAPGALVQLTHGAGHEVTPAVAADGTIVYAAVTPDEQHHEIETHLEERAPDGTIRVVTRGPADSSPAVSPDGRQLVFARPVVHDGKPDSELWLMPRGAPGRPGPVPGQLIDAARPLVNLPLTDESGPVWSRDGRFVFATSVLRGADGHVVFSSIIHIDTRETPPVARILEDRVGAIVRLTPAMTATPLDPAVLHGDPEYLTELAKIMTQLIERARAEATAPAPRGD